MLRISKLTDYATLILARLASEPEQRFTAGQIASQTHLAVPTVSKLLKQLHRKGLGAVHPRLAWRLPARAPGRSDYRSA